MWSFAKLPSDPPPVFFRKKIEPQFLLLKIASLMAETDFTLGPILVILVNLVILVILVNLVNLAILLNLAILVKMLQVSVDMSQKV